MKVALIGTNGQLGTDIKITKPTNIELFPLTRKDLDVTNKEMVYSTLQNLKPDIIINTASFHKTDECEEQVELSFKVNTIAVKYLAEVSNNLDATLIHISTDYVFDGKKIENKTPYFENDIPNPLNVYGLSKYAGEMIIKTYCKKYFIVRISSVFGLAGASGKGGNFVYTILRLAKERKELRVINDIFMTPTYTKDAAKEIWRLITEDRESGIYHSANDGICTWFEFAKEIVTLAGLDANVIPVEHTFYPMKAKRPLWSPLASRKGVKLRHWKEALNEFINAISKA